MTKQLNRRTILVATRKRLSLDAGLLMIEEFMSFMYIGLIGGRMCGISNENSWKFLRRNQ